MPNNSMHTSLHKQENNTQYNLEHAFCCQGKTMLIKQTKKKELLGFFNAEKNPPRQKCYFISKNGELSIVQQRSFLRLLV